MLFLDKEGTMAVTPAFYHPDREEETAIVGCGHGLRQHSFLLQMLTRGITRAPLYGTREPPLPHRLHHQPSFRTLAVRLRNVNVMLCQEEAGGWFALRCVRGDGEPGAIIRRHPAGMWRERS
jgi:hypothetical protein